MRSSISAKFAATLACLSLGAAACGSSPAASPPPESASVAASPSGQVGVEPWPAPPKPMELTVKAGLKPAPKEFVTNHAHAHLDVFIDGKPIRVPSGVGIKIDDPAVQVDDLPAGTKRYGGIELCNEPCISPLHTHDPDGILHTEASTQVTHTLGQFFTEWNVVLDASCVATYCSPATPIAIFLNGEPTTGDPREIKLTDQLEIAIVIGTPPAEIPKTADFSNA